MDGKKRRLCGKKIDENNNDDGDGYSCEETKRETTVEVDTQHQA